MLTRELMPALLGCGLVTLVMGVETFVRSGGLGTIRREGLRYWWWVDVVGYGIHSSGRVPKWHPTKDCSEDYCGWPPPGGRGWDDRRGDRTLDL